MLYYRLARLHATGISRSDWAANRTTGAFFILILSIHAQGARTVWRNTIPLTGMPLNYSR